MTSSTQKPNSKIKVISSWVAGIAIFAFLEFKLEEIASELGLITSFYFEVKRGDYYEGVELTSLGWFLLFLKVLSQHVLECFCVMEISNRAPASINLLLLIFSIFFGLYAAMTLFCGIFREHLGITNRRLLL